MILAMSSEETLMAAIAWFMACMSSAPLSAAGQVVGLLGVLRVASGHVRQFFQGRARLLQRRGLLAGAVRQGQAGGGDLIGPAGGTFADLGQVGGNASSSSVTWFFKCRPA